MELAACERRRIRENGEGGGGGDGNVAGRGRTLDHRSYEIGLFEQGVFVDQLVVRIVFLQRGVEVVAEVYEADAAGAVGALAVEVE